MSYQAALDLTTGFYLNEQTDEYFYKDVVSCSTAIESREVEDEKFGKLQLKEAESLILTTSGGTHIKTVLRDRKLVELMGGGEIPIDLAAVKAVRKMLREKK